MKRVVIDIGYFIRDNDDRMADLAAECLYDDVMCAVKYDELGSYIKIVDAPDATEADIPEFLLGFNDPDEEDES